jgi:3-isopropylmalate/(R)-2-methylmalate dehydratase small subunit
MLENMRGRVVRIAVDDISTDVIAPSQYRGAVADNDPNLTVLRPHVLEAVRTGLDEHVRPGDIFVCGKNFGLGSHREPAVQIFKVWGVQAVVTESAARIWFRNALAAGLPAFELEDATKLFAEDDEIEIDVGNWRVSNLTRTDNAALSPFPPTVMRILEAGGIMQLLKQRVEAEMSAST